jgi:deoxyribodipyrimidine photo-lyase
MKKTLHWFRDDLRLSDNPALCAAAAQGQLTCIYILESDQRALGGAALWWLHHSLTQLEADLKAHGVQLIFAKGKASEVLARFNMDLITWNRRYTAEGIATDKELKALFPHAKSFNGALLREPWEIKEYKVFTPFWKANLALGAFEAPLKTPLMQAAEPLPSENLNNWALLPTKPNWATQFEWQVGEKAAQTRLYGFIEEGLSGYAEHRDKPALPHSSRLAPHLRFGEISPRQIWSVVSSHESKDATKFLSEIGWREFSYHLLYHNPTLPHENFQKKFDSFPWARNERYMQAWQKGQTGYPIVDAGMRELWQTGFMHNRVRMICASFLIKHLLQDWRKGETWFWECLCDADSANNAASWQWVAGSGADAAPYFRIFNPIIQGEKFDPEGDYVRRFVPELKNVPNKYLHRPWDSPYKIDYLAPIVEHSEARDKALAAFQQL